MGMVFGRVDVAEPAFDILLTRTASATPYEIRSYGKRFAIEAQNSGKKQDENSAFRLLAKYIGVFGKPENEGATTIAMTAPVVMESKTPEKGKGTAIAMTAPVVMSQDETSGSGMMQFFLPAEYDDMSKIPKPTHGGVTIKEIAPDVGVVHRFSGSYNEKTRKEKAMQLGKQLSEDGVNMSEQEILEKFQFWGYNPPFTIPSLRRNEVFISLSKDQVDDLMKTHQTS